ncbi:hypothetical protein ACH5RR_033450 [Cinchona calisaya]|uniref:Uncharacterized protein n=1 Tax=Cinchona calisaya TaxID=153742 RepID=A0ABD2YRA1_9GENT
MFKFLCKCSKIVAYEKSCSISISTIQKYHLIQLSPLSSSSKKDSKDSILNAKIDENPHLLTVNYLIKSCGLSEKTAISASKIVNFETPDRPDSVLAVFRKQGFTDSEVSSIISGYPKVLLCRPQKTLLPKIEFFQSVGFSNADISKLLSFRGLIARSLETQIIPSFNVLKDLFTSEQDLVCPITRCPDILTRSFQSLMIANIEILREAGVPEPSILHLLKNQPRLLVRPSHMLKESAEKLEKMGLNPQDGCFARCLWRMASMDRRIWREKMAVYERWGCSEHEVLEAFMKHASFMAISTGKIMDVMDFLVLKMGHDPSVILRAPFIVTLSVKKNIVPRCAVYEVILNKGLMKKNVSLSTLLACPEKIFLKKFVECFEKEAAHLLKIYRDLKLKK